MTIKPIYRYLLSVLACLVLAGGAYFWATSMIDSLYAFRSPIKATPPAPGARLGAPITRRVVFVLIDGLRYDTSLKTDVMPTLARLRPQGAFARTHSRTPSFSEPGYSTLLTGAWPYLNDGPAFNLPYAEIPTWTQDNLFSAAARANLKTAVSGYYWFEKLIPQSAVSAHFYTPGEDRAADRAVMDAALPWLDDPSYALVLIHLDQVDYAGHHEGGARSPNWDAAANRSDALLGEVLNKLDLSKDTVFVASDHGHIDQGGHGGQDPVVLVEPFVLAGAGVKPGNAGEIQMVDVAPTLAALLGLNIPADSQGQVLANVLDLPQAEAAALPGLAAKQQETLARSYTGAIGMPIDASKVRTPSSVADWQQVIDQARQNKLLPEMLVRGLLALSVAAVPAWLFLRKRPACWPWLAIGALVCLAIFNFRYAVLSDRTYSFSSLISAEDLVLFGAVTVGIAFAIAWLLVSWRAGFFHLPPLSAGQSALTLALFTVWFLALPVLVSFAINGFGATWTTPDALTFYLALLSLVQVIMVGVWGLVFSGVSAAVGFAVQRR